MKKKITGRRMVLRIVLWVLAVFLTALIVFFAVANRAFYGVGAADLPCRKCTGEAQVVQVNGFDLYFHQLGSDTQHVPIVVLHGGPGHSSESFKGSLDFLAQDFRVIYYDQRGSGNSQIKPDAKLYTIEQMVEDLETIRKDVLGADKIILVAHSAGGALAQRYALAYPEHVEKMILVSSIKINNGIGSPFLWNIFNPVFFSLGAGFLPPDPQAADEQLASLLVQSSLPRLYDQSQVSLLENSGYVSFATWREVSRSLEGSDFADALGSLKTRTLIVFGAADNAYTGEETANLLHGLLANSTLARFDKSGHWAFLEEPEKFQQVATDFLVSNE
jgi:proline iminopeptidase